MEWFPARLFGRTQKAETTASSVFIKSPTVAPPAPQFMDPSRLVAMTRTRIVRHGMKRDKKFRGFGSPPGKF